MTRALAALAALEGARAMTPGIHDLPLAAYLADPCPEPSLSAGCAAALIDRSPRHAWSGHPRLGNRAGEDSGAADVGTVMHQLLLEDSEDGIVVVDAEDWRTKAAREAREEARAAGRTPVLAHVMDLAREAAEAVRNQIRHHRQASDFLRDGAPERTVLWQEGGTTWCRARPDWLPHDAAGPVYDLKTTTGSAAPSAWIPRIFREGHDIKAAHYLRGLEVVRGVRPAAFRFVIAEQNPPFAVSVVELDAAAAEWAERRWRRALALWENCLLNDDWPAYAPYVHVAELPGWADLKWGEAEDAAEWVARQRRPSAEALGAQARAIAAIGSPIA